MTTRELVVCVREMTKEGKHGKRLRVVRHPIYNFGCPNPKQKRFCSVHSPSGYRLCDTLGPQSSGRTALIGSEAYVGGIPTRRQLEFPDLESESS